MYLTLVFFGTSYRSGEHGENEMFERLSEKKKNVFDRKEEARGSEVKLKQKTYFLC
jgi:hypothetical protein